MDSWFGRKTFRRKKFKPKSEREQQLETAAKLATHLTESGARCHLNSGKPRYCIWAPQESHAPDACGSDALSITIRCTVHPGGILLEAGRATTER